MKSYTQRLESVLRTLLEAYRRESWVAYPALGRSPASGEGPSTVEQPRPTPAHVTVFFADAADERANPGSASPSAASQ